MSVYWIEGSDEAARLAILVRPGGHDSLESTVQRWREQEVDVVVSLLTDEDNARLGLTSEGEVCRQQGLHFISYPIEDFGVPKSLTDTMQFVSDLKEILDGGKSIGFHCQASIGRAPLIAACVLMSSGLSADAAFALVAEARGCRIPDTPRQIEWGRQFEFEVSQMTKQ